MDSEVRPLKRIALAVIMHDGRVLVSRRGAGGHLAGMWEFPGGKIEPGEDAGAAAARECMEELGWIVSPRRLLAVHHHEYEKFDVKLHAVWCMADESQPVGGERPETRWVTWDEMTALELPPANHALVEKLRGLLDPSKYEIIVEDSVPES